MLGKKDKITYGMLQSERYPEMSLTWPHSDDDRPIAMVLQEPKVITICGSMKFAEEMKEQEIKLTKDGYVVLMPIFEEGSCVNKEVSPGIYERQSTSSDELKIYRKSHMEKIRMSDAIFVINKDGYVGRHTADEIELASKFRKRIYFLEHAED